MKYKNLYEELYSVGYHKSYRTCHTKKLLPIIQKKIPLGQKILDIGCSHGTFVLTLQTLGYDAYGVDVAEKAIDVCNNRNIKNCYTQSCANLKFDDNFFDAVVSSDTLEHICLSEITQTLEGMQKIVKKNGLIILSIATKKESKVTKYLEVAKKYNISSLHTTTKPYSFWQSYFKNYYDIISCSIKNKNFTVILNNRK